MAPPRLIERTGVFPAENLGGVQIADRLGRGAASLFFGLADHVVDELLVRELADRVTVLRLMRMASDYIAVAGICGGLEPVFLTEVQLGNVVALAVAQILLPVLAEVRERGGSHLELAIALDALRGELLDHRLHPLAQRFIRRRRRAACRCALALRRDGRLGVGGRDLRSLTRDLRPRPRRQHEDQSRDHPPPYDSPFAPCSYAAIVQAKAAH